MNSRTAIVVPGWPGQPSVAELGDSAEADERPRTDYVELARMLHADVIDRHHMAGRAAPLARMVAARTSMPLGQAVEAFLRRRRYDHILAWHEPVGMPLGLLSKLARARGDVVMHGAHSSTPKRRRVLGGLRVYTSLRALSYEASAQLEYAARIGVPREKLFLAIPGVDTHFWRPIDSPAENMICSVGIEQRDYATLVDAVRGLDVRLDILAGGFDASAESPGSALGALPPNTRLVGGGSRRLRSTELRDLYGRSRFVVVSTHDVDYNAGITVVKEAMAMGKAVVVTRSRAQVDIVRDGEHGLYVPPGDVAALRAAITYLLDHPEEADRMGKSGRAHVEDRHTLEGYVERLAALVQANAQP